MPASRWVAGSLDAGGPSRLSQVEPLIRDQLSAEPTLLFCMTSQIQPLTFTRCSTKAAAPPFIPAGRFLVLDAERGMSQGRSMDTMGGREGGREEEEPLFTSSFVRQPFRVNN